jgi:hypothetical protein
LDEIAVFDRALSVDRIDGSRTVRKEAGH